MTQKYKDFIKQVKDTIFNQPIPPHYNPDEWKDKNFNCYAYALQICMDLSEKRIRPGFTKSKRTNYRKTAKRIIKYFKDDCDRLGLRVLATTLDEKIGTSEYKVAVYLRKRINHVRSDFHFARLDSNGIWSEKNGWFSEIKILEEESVTKNENGYEFIGVFRVSKK